MRTALYSLVRNTIHVSVPEGWPAERGEVLAEVAVPHTGGVPAIIDALWWPGCGYSVHFQMLDAVEPRRLSLKSKQSLRRKAMERRVLRDAPLFGSELITRELHSNPDYFGEIN